LDLYWSKGSSLGEGASLEFTIVFLIIRPGLPS
jgi:hypothetical protein